MVRVRVSLVGLAQKKLFEMSFDADGEEYEEYPLYSNGKGNCLA